MQRPSVPREGWQAVGETVNTRYFYSEPDVLVVIPQAGLKDNAESAYANTDFQMAFAKRLGRPCSVLVQMTSLLSQDADARRIYAERMDPACFYGAALVATNAMSRAIASFFLGLSKPRFPTKVFDSLDSAFRWLAEIRPGSQA